MIDWDAHRSALGLAQRKALYEAAEEGVPFPLLICLAARREDAALEQALSNAPDDCRERRLMSALLTETSSRCIDALGDVPYTTACWFAYVFTQQALRANDLEGAVRAATWLLIQKKRPYVGALNLLGDYLLACGQHAPAAQFFDRSLRVAPHQMDVHQKLGAARSGEAHAWPAPSLLPFEQRHASCGFYLPVYNGEAFLETVIPSILRQSVPVDALIMVDDGSTDASCEMAARFPVEIIRHRENRGLAAARNTAFQTLQNDYIATCDGDAWLDANYLLHIQRELHNQAHAPEAVGGRMTESFRDTPPDRHRDAFLSQDTSTQRRHVNSGPFPQGTALAEVYLPGCNTVMLRHAVLETGGYDERFRTSCEDGDMYQKLRRAGAAVSTVPEARVHHLRRDTTRSILATSWRYNYWSYRDQGLFDHPDRLRDHEVTFFEGLREKVRHPATQASPEILFLLLLDYLHLRLRILEEAGARRALPESQRIAYQAQILQQVRDLDHAYGGQLVEKCLIELEPYVVPGAPEVADSLSCPSLCEVFGAGDYAMLCDYDETRLLPPQSEEERFT